MYKYAPETYDKAKEFNEVEQFYSYRYKEDVTINVGLVRHDALDLSNGLMQAKIENFANKYGFDKEQVRQHILDDDMFAAGFSKDPTKQSCHQKYALEYIKEKHPCLNIRSLPNGGRNSKYIYNGNIVMKPDLPADFTGTSKSIDFEASINKGDRTVKIYFSHKHTTKNGGMQDNQWNDLASFMDCAKAVDDCDAYFIALADGDYYNNITPNSNLTRMEFLREYHGTDHVLAMNTAELNDFLESL